MSTKVTLTDGEVKWVEYVLKFRIPQLRALSNAGELLSVLSKCTGEKTQSQIYWGEYINELTWSIGNLMQDEQVMALVTQHEKVEFKLAVEKLIWVFQKAEKKGHLDENLKATLKPFMLPPRQVGDVTLDLKSYGNTQRLHILMHIFEVTRPTTPGIC